MFSGGSCIALWEVVDYRSVSLQLSGDNTATGFWWSILAIGGAVYIIVGNGTKQRRPDSVNITR